MIHMRRSRQLRAILAVGAVGLGLLASGCVQGPPARPADTTPSVPATTPSQAAPAPGAQRPPPIARFVAVEWSALPGWREDAVEAIEPALRAQCAGAATPAALAGPLARMCASYASRGALPMRDWIERTLQPHAIESVDVDSRASREGLITGYHEPLLRGSRAPRGAFRTPLHRRPADLLAVDLRTVAPTTEGLRLRGRLDGTRVVPYHDRRAIETARPLAGQELMWVDDPVDAFFLHVQGSGRVRLAEGDTVRVAYADQNGHPYVPLGRVLVERGLLTREQANAPGIKAFLRADPARAAELMRENPSYVFFTEERLPPGADAAGAFGPRGSLGVPLTPRRSVAVDPRFLPLGAPVFVDTPHPLRTGRLAQAFVAQDTGGAIRGAVRADVFWGPGQEAEQAAGVMRSPGRMWLLWPRGEPLPAAGAAAGAGPATP